MARRKKPVKGPKDPREFLVAANRKARHDYAILETYEAGMVLTGTEVKALRQGRCSLVDGFVDIENGEAWLHQVHVPEYAQGTWNNHATRRRRKLLLHRREIEAIDRRVREAGLTVVPLRLYFTGGRAKVEVALARGLKTWDKRHRIAERDARLEVEAEMSRRLKRG